jgi:putative hemolysin
MALSYLYTSLVFLVFSLILFALKTSLSNISDNDNRGLFEPHTCGPLIRIHKTLGESDKAFLSIFNLTGMLVFLIFSISISLFSISYHKAQFTSFPYFLLMCLIIATSTVILFGGVEILARLSKKWTFNALGPLAYIPLFLFLPFTYPIAIIGKKLSPARSLEEENKEDLVKKHLLDILSLDAHKAMDPIKRRLINSLAHFDDKTCREIMIPRMRIECLENTSSIFEALTLFIEEGFSRIPIFDKSIDHITGVLLYKDVLEYTFKRGMSNFDTIKKAPITSLVTPILYAPENKKISELFQVMHSRKIHATIVVNEYGCTEGLVTIEDIFEELIGSEILDEHDEEDELLYKKTHDKGWIIEADVSIIDAEREFGISLPHDSEYETIGGLISTKLGVIPNPGSIIHLDGYEIKVLSSNDRKILKVKISFPQKETE